MKFLENPRAHFAREKIFDGATSQNVIRFVVDNFFDMYHLDSISEDNLNHFFDFMISYRDCYHYLGLFELVDCANYVLDSLALLLPNEPPYSQNKYQYRSRFYRPPESIALIEPVNPEECVALLKKREQEVLSGDEIASAKNQLLNKQIIEEIRNIDNEMKVVSK